MRQLATLMVVVVLILMSPTAASGQYTFGDWARDKGYLPGDAMPEAVVAEMVRIDSLDGIGEFDWTATPTVELYLEYRYRASNRATSAD